MHDSPSSIVATNAIVCTPKTSSGLLASEQQMSSLYLISRTKRAIPNIFEVELIMGKSGGYPVVVDNLIWWGESMKGGGNGREWEVDAASALIRIIAAR
ncbi:hypothetical protein Tco_0385488 [Tanacetum coccineum]